MAGTTAASEPVSTKWAQAFVERWLAAWNSRQPERPLELMTEDIIYDDSAWPQTMCGHAEVRELLEAMWRAFPDFTIERLGAPLVASDGPRVAFWWRARGTNTGPWGPSDSPAVPATGNRVEFEGADFHQYHDGKVTRLRIVFDMADILRQMGLLPAPGSRGERAIVLAQQLRAPVQRR